MYMYKKDINQMSSVAFVISSAYFWLVHHHLPQYSNTGDTINFVFIYILKTFVKIEDFNPLVM